MARALGHMRAAPSAHSWVLPFQLSYNMVSACTRLCRMRLLCHLKKKEEEENLVGACPTHMGPGEG